ncbi:hypothetical protein J5N97_028430 [Dioscorea zingiberensis]|uniref:Secreted protein n=1 Tax=Dioscorea zingiberensis TaxID=325984 RepID=A0A9D5BYY7_9LILI|nr:hypothetical protein J5N97_028430 [Dioscorea zingiberensis]
MIFMCSCELLVVVIHHRVLVAAVALLLPANPTFPHQELVVVELLLSDQTSITPGSLPSSSPYQPSPEKGMKNPNKHLKEI